jgi:hypothetical protein
MDSIETIRKAANKRFLFTQHALDEMNAEAELISTEEVRYVIFDGEIIEEYPEDKRGQSYLMLGKSTAKRTIHVVCAPKDDYLAIITAYIPTLDRWDEDFRVRRKR